MEGEILHGGDSRGELSGGIFRLVSEPGAICKAFCRGVAVHAGVEIEKPTKIQSLVPARCLSGWRRFRSHGAEEGLSLRYGRGMTSFLKRDMAMAQSGLTGLPRSGKNEGYATASASAD
ncbi:MULTISPECIES: hypothetical protein [unclassified Ensifer]|uniref:hypothetical protein n=1 Tax=unclassified Ensifer TaxID=2633371 RepID=UPI0012E3456D|nr:MULTISPECIES: hypothetical protein [unclassified Ensifer]